MERCGKVKKKKKKRNRKEKEEKKERGREVWRSGGREVGIFKQILFDKEGGTNEVLRRFEEECRVKDAHSG